jgi:D-glycero-alpha-D-manno-heptose-7-phosphate kinase
LMHQTVDQAIDLLNSNAPIVEFGKLLHEAWLLKRKLSEKISNPVIDNIYETALRSGATGGKILGAGAGGFMLIFVSPQKRKKVQMALKKLLEVKFSFENNGSQIIYYNP